MHQHGPWTIVKSRQVYQDPWLSLNCDDVLRLDGSLGTYSTVQIKPGVCAIAIDDNGVVHLTREFHYAVGRYTLEGASGGIEPHESPLESAKRELREELGIVADQWTDLGCVDPLTGALLSPTRLFAARNLTFVTAEPEIMEQIDCVQFPLQKAIDLIFIGEITHAPTCVALLKMALIAAGRES